MTDRIPAAVSRHALDKEPVTRETDLIVIHLLRHRLRGGIGFVHRATTGAGRTRMVAMEGHRGGWVWLGKGQEARATALKSARKVS